MQQNDKQTQQFIEDYVKADHKSFYFWKSFFLPWAKLAFRSKIYGKENIPETGAVILASNHIHMSDPAYMIMATDRVVRFLAKKELLDSVLGSIYRGLCAIPVDRSIKDHNSMAAAEYALKQGEVIGIFPEGSRNRKDPKQLMPFKYGAVRLASKTGSPIVPIALYSKGRPLIDTYTVMIGEPYYIDENADLDQENEILKEKMTDLLNQIS